MVDNSSDESGICCRLSHDCGQKLQTHDDFGVDGIAFVVVAHDVDTSRLLMLETLRRTA